MTAVQARSAACHVVDGVTVLAPLGREPRMPREDLRETALQLRDAEGVDAYACVSGGRSGEVLTVPSTLLLVRDDVLGLIPDVVLDDVAGAGARTDPLTALMDAQWRLSLHGRSVHARPCAQVLEAPASPDEARVRRQGLLTLMETNLGEELRGSLLPVAQILMLSGALSGSGTDTTSLDLQRSPGGDSVGSLEVPQAGLVGAWAVDGALGVLESHGLVRKELQDSRRVPDAFLMPMIREALPCLMSPEPGTDSEALARLMRLTGADEVMERRPRVSVFTRSAARLADVVPLAGAAEVCEGTPSNGSPDAIVLLDLLPAQTGEILPEGVPLLIDLRGVDVLDWLREASPMEDRGQALARACQRADRLLVSDQEQRDVLLGALAGVRRVNDVVYDDDPSLSRLVSIGDEADLEDFFRRPLRAADVALEEPDGPEPPRAGDLALAVRYLREGGVRNVALKAAGRARRLSGFAKEGN